MELSFDRLELLSGSFNIRNLLVKDWNRHFHWAISRDSDLSWVSRDNDNAYDLTNAADNEQVEIERYGIAF